MRQAAPLVGVLDGDDPLVARDFDEQPGEVFDGDIDVHQQPVVFECGGDPFGGSAGNSSLCAEQVDVFGRSIEHAVRDDGEAAAQRIVQVRAGSQRDAGDARL